MLAQPIGAERASSLQLRPYQLDVQQHDREGRAQVMRGGRQELVAHAGGLLGPQLGVLDLPDGAEGQVDQRGGQGQ